MMPKTLCLGSFKNDLAAVAPVPLLPLPGMTCMSAFLKKKVFVSKKQLLSQRLDRTLTTSKYIPLCVYFLAHWDFAASTWIRKSCTRTTPHPPAETDKGFPADLT
ncbi:hypothetical protein EDC04DRAFT_3140968, partial [Pisolithus marmoratus]